MTVFSFSYLRCYLNRRREKIPKNPTMKVYKFIYRRRRFLILMGVEEHVVAKDKKIKTIKDPKKKG